MSRSTIRLFKYSAAVAGQYTIIATRYGQELGGTQGNYTLTLTGPTGDIPPEVLALNLPTGDIEVTLLWNTLADLQLLVRDPSLDSVFDDTPSVPSGGRLVAAGNELHADELSLYPASAGRKASCRQMLNGRGIKIPARTQASRFYRS
jgi:hypothetical protein